MDRATAQQVNQPGTGLAALRAQLRAATLRPEADASGELLADLSVARAALERAATRAARWVETARADQRSRPLVDRMLEQFPLDSAQGKALMSLAEALLRTPDPRRADQLIAERLASVRAAGVPGDTDLLLRTGFTLLGAAGRLLPEVSAELSGEFSAASLARPMIAPIVRAALRQSMQLLGHAFIVGETIDAALARGRSEPGLALCSFDVLGEGARTESDAQRYYDSYAHAIEALSAQAGAAVHARSGISVKLSALEPRYTQLQSARVNEHLAPRILELARLHRRRRGGRSARPVARHRRDAGAGPGHALLAGARTRGTGLRPPRAAGARLGGGAGPRQRSTHDGAAGQGGVLGQRDQARAGARPRQLPRLHLQGRHRRQLPRVRAAAVRRRRGDLPAVRHPQRLHGCRGARAGPGQRGVRVPAPARHG